jgi:hypothetical protein
VTADELGDLERCHESIRKAIVSQAGIDRALRVAAGALRIRVRVLPHGVPPRSWAPGGRLGVDLNDRTGVWWWQPGGSDCGSRSTGPGVFHPEAATVTRSAQRDAYEVGFRLGTHSSTRPFIDVRLLVEGGTMRMAGSKEHVRLLRRSDLAIPEMPPRRGSAG